MEACLNTIVIMFDLATDKAPAGIGPAEWEARIELANAYRIIAGFAAVEQVPRWLTCTTLVHPHPAPLSSLLSLDGHFVHSRLTWVIVGTGCMISQHQLQTRYGWTHCVYNHITLKLPDCCADDSQELGVAGGTALFLINPFGCRFDEVC